MSSFDALHSATVSLQNAREHLQEEKRHGFAVKELPQTPLSPRSSSRHGSAASRRGNSSKGGRRSNPSTAQSEGARELNRQLQHAQLHKQMDDAQFRIDTRIRAVAALDNEDFDEKFGVERAKTTGLSLQIRSLEDRTMKAQAMLALEHYMGSFKGKKIYDELEAADNWFRGQVKKFRTELQAVGVDLAETSIPEDLDFLFDDPCFDDDEEGNEAEGRANSTGDPALPHTRQITSRERSREKSSSSRGWSREGRSTSGGGMRPSTGEDAPESVDTQSSATLMEGLLLKLRSAQEEWTLQTGSIIRKLEKDLSEKSVELNTKIRQYEHEIAVLHRKSNSLDEGLSSTDEGKIRSSVDAKFQASQTKLEEKIQSQRDRHAAIVVEMQALKREVRWLEALRAEGVPANRVNVVVQQILTKSQASTREAEDQLAAKQKELERVLHEADDARDEMRSLQAKSKQMATDLEKIKADQTMELKGLKYQYGMETVRSDEVRSKVEDVEAKMKAVQKTARGKARNTMRMSAVGRMSRNRESGSPSGKSRASFKKSSGLRSPGVPGSPGESSTVFPIMGSVPRSPSADLMASPGPSRHGGMEVEHEQIWPRPAAVDGGRPGSGGGAFGNGRSGSTEARPRSTLLSIQEGSRGTVGGSGGEKLTECDEDDEDVVVNPSELANIFIDDEGSEFLEDFEDDLTADGSGDNSGVYIPSALSNICEAAYLRIAHICLAKAAEEATRTTKKKKAAVGTKKSAKKSTVSETGAGPGTVEVKRPQLTVTEGLGVFRYVLDDLLAGKYVEKGFNDELAEKMALFKREMPIMRAEEVEEMLTKFSVSLCNHVLSYAPHLLVAQNKHCGFRLILFNLLALIGIIYECCPLTNDDLVVHFSSNPAVVQFMEEVGIDIIGCITGGAPKNVESELEAKERKLDDQVANKGDASLNKKSKKSSKPKKKNNKSVEDTRCSTTPLHPKIIFKRADIVVSDREIVLKHAGLLPYLDELRKWIREVSHGKVKEDMDESWRNCSRLHFPETIHPMTSEDRHHMCAYQEFFLHIASIGVVDCGNGRYENMIPREDLLSRFSSVLKPSIRFDETFADVSILMKCAAPSAVPLLLAMEFARRVVDEDIIKRNMLIRIENGEDEDLAFLRTKSDTPQESDNEQSREALMRKQREEREAAFLHKLPHREKMYLVERKVDIAEVIQHILQLTDADDDEYVGKDDEDEEEPEKSIKLTKMLKKALLSHLLNIEEKAASNLSRDNLPVVLSEVEGFSKHMESLIAIRNKTLDVGGVFTKPLRDKLEVLNSQIIAAIGANRELEVNIEMKVGEMQALNEIIDELLKGLDDIMEGRVKIVEERLEQLILDSAPESIQMREERAAAHEQLKADLKRLTALVEKDRSNYEEMVAKLGSIALAMSYSTADAWNQGLHIMASLMRQLIRRKLEMTQKGLEGGSMNSIYLQSDSSTSTTFTIAKGEINMSQSQRSCELPAKLERIVMLVIEFMGKDSLISLGAMHLDDLITDDLAVALRQYLSSAQVARRIKPPVTTSTPKSRGGKSGRSALTGKVEVEKLADETALPQLVTATDILESRTASASTPATKRLPTAPKSAAPMSPPTPSTDVAGSRNDEFVIGAGDGSHRPPLGKMNRINGPARMMSTFASGSSMPQKGGATLALIASGDGSVNPYFDGRKSSVFSGASSKSSMKSGSTKSVSSGNKGSSVPSVSHGERSGASLVADLTHVSSSTLSDIDQLISAPTDKKKSASAQRQHNVVRRGRLRSTVSSFTGVDGGDSTCTLGSGK